MEPRRASERLDSWKEIAAYLRKGERTVRRWEQSEALPVHRHQHDGRSSVYAFPAELDRWLAERAAPPPVQPEAEERVDTRRTTAAAPWKIGGVTLIILLAGATALRWDQRGRTSAANPDPLPLTTLNGQESSPSFFDDGKQVAFVWQQGDGASDIYIKAIGSETLRRITNTPEQELSPVVSPDGKKLAFLRVKQDRSSVVLYTLAGGSERETTDVSSPHAAFYGNPGPFLAWFPDSKRLVIVNKNRLLGPTALYVHNVEAGHITQLTTPPASAWGDCEPAVSPDGSTLVFSRTSSVAVSDLYKMDLSSEAGNAEPLLVNKKWNRSPVWTPDGRDIVFTSGYWGHVRLLRLTVAGRGVPQPLTGGDGGFHPTISRSGNLAFMRYQPVHEIWRLTLTASGQAVGPPALIITSSRSELHPQISPDGQWLAYHSDRSGSQEIWIARADGTEPRKVTDFSGSTAGSPRWAPDGTQIAFDAIVDGQHEIFVCGRNGENLRRLTDHPDADVLPKWSFDGKVIYFASRRTGEYQIWRMPSAGGPAVQITQHGGLAAEESRDGAYLYYTRADNNNNSLLRVPVSGGPETEVLEGVFGRRFALADNGVYFQAPNAGAPMFLFKNFRNGKVQEVAPAKSFLVNPLSLSRDRKYLYFAASGTPRADLVLIHGFAQ